MLESRIMSDLEFMSLELTTLVDSLVLINAFWFGFGVIEYGMFFKPL